DDGRDAEDHAEHCQQRSQFVRAEVLEPEAQLGEKVGGPQVPARVGERAHLPATPDTGPLDGFARRSARSGSTSAITSPSFRPETIARLSVAFSTLTSRGSKR